MTTRKPSRRIAGVFNGEMTRPCRTAELTRHFRELIISGGYQPHDKLPTTAEAAREHGVARATVGSIYRQLQAEGLVYTLPREGSYVADRPKTTGGAT